MSKDDKNGAIYAKKRVKMRKIEQNMRKQSEEEENRANYAKIRVNLR